jgi:hypothetical protein
MPTFVQATSNAAHAAGRRARLALGTALALVALATIASPFHSLNRTIPVSRWNVNVATAVAAVAFALALLARLYRMANRPEQVSSESWSLSEQVKSLAWIYAVGGTPLSVELPSDGMALWISAASDLNPRDLYVRAVQGMIDEAAARHVPLQVPQQGIPVQVITDWMVATRAYSLSDRARVYGAQRIGEQQRFYAARAAAARRWTRGIVLLEGAGALAAGLRALDIVQFDLIGVAATLAAAGTAWLQFNERGMLASTDSAMGFKLAGYELRCQQSTWDEHDWAAYVREVEDLLGQEHSSWLRAMQTV